MLELTRNPRFERVEWKRGSGSRAERPHAHREWSASLVRSGTAEVRIGEKTIELASGDFIALPPGQVHLCSPVGAVFSFSVLYLPEETLGASFPRAAFVGGVDIERFDRICARIVSASSEEEIGRVSAGLRAGRRYDLSPDAPSRCPLFADRDAVEHPSADAEDRFRRYRRCVADFGAGAQSLKQIKRIEESKDLLRRGCSVARTAADCGFWDQSHYVKTFKKFTGLTPSEYNAR